MAKLEHYLDQVCRGIGGPIEMRQHVRQELREHLLDAIAGHKAAGLSEAEALDKALAEFGRPDEVRTELEATHGKRMTWILDKAMQWKEKTMKAKWLWASWAHGMLGALIALEILFITFYVFAIIPRFQKLMMDGIIDPEILDDSGVRWFVNFLYTVSHIGGHYTLWLIVVPSALWILFEWRVKSDNKSLMRLSALGTVAVGLLIVIVLMSMGLVISYMLGAPALSRIARPWVVEQVAELDAALQKLEQAQKTNDWKAMQEPMQQAIGATTRLSVGPAPTALVKENNNLRIDDMRSRIKRLRELLDEAHRAVLQNDAARLDAALREFRQSYEPVQEAAKRPAS